MDVLWDADGWLTARDVAARLQHERDLAYTTVLTVLERLERKGFVRRERAARAHRYAASNSREAVVAEAMLEALGTADDRGLALIRFVGSVSPEEAEILRRALARQEPAQPENSAPAAATTSDMPETPGISQDSTAGDGSAAAAGASAEAGPAEVSEPPAAAGAADVNHASVPQSVQLSPDER